jgi:hypothetical protein
VRPLHVESRVTNGPDAAQVDGGASGLRTSNRVTRQPGRWSRLLAIVAALGLVAGAGALLLLGTGEAERPDARPGDAGLAYLEAVQRLGYARSFAYRGSVHAAGPSALRPGPSIATDVTVEGAVRLPQSITRDVAVDDRGGAVETVTSGPTVWSRSAPSIERLAEAAWEVIGPSPSRAGGYPGRFGAALVADVLRSAGDRRLDGTDAAGRTVIRATVPPDDRDERYGDALDGADVRITLDEAGDVAHVALASAEPKPRLVLRLDIVRLGDPGTLEPSDVAIPARRSAPTDVLDAAGVEPVELGALPPGWALTNATVDPGTNAKVGPGRSGRACPSLTLEYRDLRAVAGGSLQLGVTTAACGGGTDRAGAAPFRAGRYRGSIEEWSEGTLGAMSDGATGVWFTSDLPSDHVIPLLSSLRPFDPDADPGPLATASTG